MIHIRIMGSIDGLLIEKTVPFHGPLRVVQHFLILLLGQIYPTRLSFSGNLLGSQIANRIGTDEPEVRILDDLRVVLA